MCFDEKNFDSKEGFVSRAIEKRVRNKRRRDPDMYVDVLLSSTVKRLKYELVNEQYQRKQLDEREISQIPKDRDIFSSNVSIQKELPEESEVKIAVECLQSTLSTLDAEIRSESLRSAGTFATNTTREHSIVNSKKSSNMDSSNKSTVFSDNTEIDIECKTDFQPKVNDDEVDFDTLMQSLLDICEPLNDNVDDLMKEYSIDPLSSGTFDFLNSNDPFLPGMLEVMCS
ncbi:uncharacterized protein LOC110233939 isoform X1 [Exaiptasia diaphana]|uniref:SERTA domain-containing protein n=1 Tax=Exaiptasia diaphana TaxID=2652724 RepID=A0A913WVX6_EXADI|nr:uncharacterized protein LOC110233939 isoform X1 [Exaiptasia diaphana]KXJ17525.1 hypothetical protein AC249_AIPGENE2511 [Exaiptasia diaphana]